MPQSRKPAVHRGIETAAYILEGEVEMYFGDRLQDRRRAWAAEYVFVPTNTSPRAEPIRRGVAD
jgi:uncharacterized RmlC-like cupin family protein